MPLIHLVTRLHAPLERCFDLARCIDLHTRTAAPTRETVVAGRATGLIGLGETVTWRGRHLGSWHIHQSLIVAYDRPHHFRDEMQRGRFRSFVHDHFFRAEGDHTVMTDELRFESPLGPLGHLANYLLVTGHLRGFLVHRNALLRQAAETDDWRTYLTDIPAAAG